METFFVCNYQNKNKIHVKMTEYELNTCNTLHYKQAKYQTSQPTRARESLISLQFQGLL